MSNKVSMVPRLLLLLGVFVLSFAGHFIWFVSASKQACATNTSNSCCAPGTQCGPAAATVTQVSEAESP